MKQTISSMKKKGFPVLTMLAAALMVGGVFRSVLPSEAADTVCGDAVVEEPEACDDGNLRSGDGCSSACTVEACGNAVLDFSEQCDDGNVRSGDGCNTYCQIEFCGDSVIQEKRAEECDDGNGISGDGCTSACTLEGPRPHPAPPDNDGRSAEDTVNDTPAQQVPALPPSIVNQAAEGLAFLATDAGKDYLDYLTREETIELETVLKKLAAGRRLSKQEREWAAALIAKFEEAKLAERTRYTDLLKQFIATPISTEVVEEKELQKTRLIDVQVPVAIEELKQAVEILRRGELKSEVLADMSRLKRQGLDLTDKLPVGYQEKLDPGTRPIEVFATLKGLKEATENYASTDIPTSLDVIRDQVQALRAALPILEQEYDISPSELESFLSTIDTVSLDVTRQDTERLVGAVNRLLSYLEREEVFTTADIASLELQATHAAASASRLMKDSGRSDIVTTGDVAAFVDGLALSAPQDAKPAFERGTEIMQRVELLKFLQNDARITDLRTILRKDGRTDFDERYNELREYIGNVGTSNRDDTACDDTMQDALRCTSEYLVDLQENVRGRSFFSRIIGNLQDYFNIDS